MAELQFTTVGAKQDGSNDRWQYVWEHIGEIIPKSQIDDLLDKTEAEIRQFIKGKKVGYSWSGGKDSVVLQLLMERIGIEPCVFAMTRELEYPHFLKWVTDHMPWGLEVIASEHTYAWLAQHQDWIFPETGTVANKWFSGIQHQAQTTFFHRHNLDYLIMGRRHVDRNYTGKDGVYSNRYGVTRYSPIRSFSQEDVLAICYYYNLPLAPFYGWVNGWVCGTGCWPARQWTYGKGWDEIWDIDPTIVYEAARWIPAAAIYLESR